MNRPTYPLAVATALGAFWLLTDSVSAQQTPRYPLDDKLANEPAPWAVTKAGSLWLLRSVGNDFTSRPIYCFPDGSARKLIRALFVNIDL